MGNVGRKFFPKNEKATAIDLLIADLKSDSPCAGPLESDEIPPIDPKPSPMEIDTECNSLLSAASDSTVPVEKIFDFRLVFEWNDRKRPSEPTNHTGVVELCNFMINHFSAIKMSLNLDDNSSPKITSQRARGSAKRNATQTKSTSQATPKFGKRRSSTTKRALDDSEPKTKKNKNNSEKAATEEVAEEVKRDCCLARWTDKKYYAGRVIEQNPGNKFSVLFGDGAMKTLAPEVIVFGAGNVLPLMNHSVHVLISDDSYEPGLVTKIDIDGDDVEYTVVAESKTVTCSASDIYLMDDQAKAIHNSIKSKEVLMPAKLEETMTTMSSGRASRGKKTQPIASPEPGFSSDIDKKKAGRRSNKMYK